jgi:hypothetical protein
MTRELTVAELSAKLAELPQRAVVRVVYRSEFPLQEVVLGVVSSDELTDEGRQGATAADGGPVVYIVADGNPDAGGPYGPRDAWGAVRRKQF